MHRFRNSLVSHVTAVVTQCGFETVGQVNAWSEPAVFRRSEPFLQDPFDVRSRGAVEQKKARGLPFRARLVRLHSVNFDVFVLCEREERRSGSEGFVARSHRIAQKLAIRVAVVHELQSYINKFTCD